MHVRVITMNTKAYCTVRTITNPSKVKYQNRSKIDRISKRHKVLTFIFVVYTALCGVSMHRGIKFNVEYVGLYE